MNFYGLSKYVKSMRPFLLLANNFFYYLQVGNYDQKAIYL